MSIELFESVEDNIHERMLEGFVDVAVGYKRSSHPELRPVHVASRRPYAIVAREHPLAQRETVSLQDLVEEPLILITVGAADVRNLGWFADAGLTPHVRWTTHDIDLTFALVGQGHGYALMLHRQHHDLTVNGDTVQALELDPPVQPVPVYLTTSNVGAQTSRVREFMRIGAATMESMPAWTGFIAPSTAGR